ncbi:hypothetical protein OQX63_08870 [Pedobacter sp. PF22-3]|uniref:hypothetical protein n=1 Tax=Pedobacter sp. PF22-3 TaxID=2994467 RepID=UPI002246DB1D|nr:hypothetical protein [Pedobacter sp. PF22-3]MCX2493579.1 hypothetical protein [Pedobacter sp. PF22-3]
MIQLNLLELVLKQFPTLNFDSNDDIIKVEKILKAEAKLERSIKINDIEQLILFLKTYGNRFIPILKDKNIGIIVAGKRGTVNSAKLDHNQISDETLEEFEKAFSENILDYLKYCIRNNKWNSLRSIFMNYPFLIGDFTRNQIYEVLKHKNQSIISALYNDQFVNFISANAYAGEIQYYTCLSCIDALYFDDDILSINNIISEKQRTSLNNRIYLGKILYAATFFIAYSDQLKQTLENNRQIALQWIHPQLQFEDNHENDWSAYRILVYIAAALAIIILISVGGTSFIGPSILGISFLARLASRLNK